MTNKTNKINFILTNFYIVTIKKHYNVHLQTLTINEAILIVKQFNISTSYATMQKILTTLNKHLTKVKKTTKVSGVGTEAWKRHLIAFASYYGWSCLVDNTGVTSAEQAIEIITNNYLNTIYTVQKNTANNETINL